MTLLDWSLSAVALGGWFSAFVCWRAAYGWRRAATRWESVANRWEDVAAIRSYGSGHNDN